MTTVGKCLTNTHRKEWLEMTTMLCQIVVHLISGQKIHVYESFKLPKYIPKVRSIALVNFIFPYFF